MQSSQGEGSPSQVRTSSSTAREDPWPKMERQVDAMLNDLMIQLQRYEDGGSATIIAENELVESIESCAETVEDMRFALDTAMEHPESFSIPPEDLQARAELIRSWERSMSRAHQVGSRIKQTQQQRVESAREINRRGIMDENSLFLKQEMDVQQSVMQDDEQTIDRLTGGLHRVRDTAINIQDELNTQEHVMNDIETNMTRVQTRIDGALKKVGKLIDSTSDRGKMICIGVLLVILVLLIFFVIK